MTPIAFRRSRSWNVPETRSPRPGLWLFALGLTGMLLTEVWGSARVTELSLRLEQSRSALAQAEVRLEYVQATLERNTTRAELTPVASAMGLAPTDARQIVALPASYLDADEGARETTTLPMLAWAERASRALVPEATARDRSGRRTN